MQITHSHETFLRVLVSLGSGGQKLHFTSAEGFIVFTNPLRDSRENFRFLHGYSIPHFLNAYFCRKQLIVLILAVLSDNFFNSIFSNNAQCERLSALMIESTSLPETIERSTSILASFVPKSLKRINEILTEKHVFT